MKLELHDETRRGRPSEDLKSPKGRVREFRRLAKEGYVRKDIADVFGIKQTYVNYSVVTGLTVYESEAIVRVLAFDGENAHEVIVKKPRC